MEKIKVGKIVNAVGLKGEVKVYNYSDSSEIYEITPEVYVGDKLMEIENVRLQKNMVILKVAGIDDRNAAEAAKGREIFITEEDLPELEGRILYQRPYRNDCYGRWRRSRQGKRCDTKYRAGCF